MDADIVLGFIGKVVVLILLLTVPALILNFAKSLRQGSKASNIPYSAVEWIILLTVYVIGGFFFVRWVLA